MTNNEELIADVIYEDDTYEQVEPLSDVRTNKANTTVVVDTKTGELKDVNLSPWDIICEFAKATNTIIKDPRSGCRHCYGRGYVGLINQTNQPVPCNCIFPVKSKVEKIQEMAKSTKYQLANMNKKQLRNYVKANNIKLEVAKPIEQEV